MSISNQRKKNRHKRILAAVIAVLGVCILVTCILLTRNVTDMSQTVKTVIVAGGCIVLVTAVVISVILDRGACRFECQKCCLSNIRLPLCSVGAGQQTPASEGRGYPPKCYLKYPQYTPEYNEKAAVHSRRRDLSRLAHSVGRPENRKVVDDA